MMCEIWYASLSIRILLEQNGYSQTSSMNRVKQSETKSDLLLKVTVNKKTLIILKYLLQLHDWKQSGYFYPMQLIMALYYIKWMSRVHFLMSYPHFGPKNTRLNFLSISDTFTNLLCITLQFTTVLQLHTLLFLSFNFCIKSYKRVFWSFPTKEPISVPTICP